MKLSKSTLKQIIKEELENLFAEELTAADKKESEDEPKDLKHK